MQKWTGETPAETQELWHPCSPRRHSCTILPHCVSRGGRGERAATHVIDRCEHRGIEGSKVFECRALISQVEDAEAALAFALKSMQEAHLEKALQMCDAFDYTSDSVEHARDLLKKVIKAAKGVKQALKRAPKFKASMIEKVVKFCRGFGYDTETLYPAVTI